MVRFVDRGVDYATRPFEWAARLLPDAYPEDTPGSGSMDEPAFSASPARDKKIQD